MKKRLGGRDILIWKPDEFIDDVSLSEIDNMEKWHTGKVILPRRWSSFEQMRRAGGLEHTRQLLVSARGLWQRISRKEPQPDG